MCFIMMCIHVPKLFVYMFRVEKQPISSPHLLLQLHILSFSISFPQLLRATPFIELLGCYLPLLRRPQDELCLHVVNHLELSG